MGPAGSSKEQERKREGHWRSTEKALRHPTTSEYQQGGDHLHSQPDKDDDF